jgi:hypothetical protein
MQTTTSICHRRLICGALGIIDSDNSCVACSQLFAYFEQCHCWHHVDLNASPMLATPKLVGACKVVLNRSRHSTRPRPARVRCQLKCNADNASTHSTQDCLARPGGVLRKRAQSYCVHLATLPCTAQQRQRGGATRLPFDTLLPNSKLIACSLSAVPPAVPLQGAPMNADPCFVTGGCWQHRCRWGHMPYASQPCWY